MIPAAVAARTAATFRGIAAREACPSRLAGESSPALYHPSLALRATRSEIGRMDARRPRRPHATGHPMARASLFIALAWALSLPAGVSASAPPAATAVTERNV